MELLGTVLSWLFIWPFHVSLEIVKYPITPIAVETCSTEDKKHLCWGFRWLETIDNDLGGDSGWKKNHIEPGSDPYSDWNRIKWLWRNGGNWTNYNIFGIEANKEITPPFEPGFNEREDGFWLIRDRFDVPFFENKQFEMMWGWHLYGTINSRHKYVFTNRFQDRL